jgi:hypothetical protein
MASSILLIRSRWRCVVRPYDDTVCEMLLSSGIVDTLVNTPRHPGVECSAFLVPSKCTSPRANAELSRPNKSRLSSRSLNSKLELLNLNDAQDFCGHAVLSPHLSKRTMLNVYTSCPSRLQTFSRAPRDCVG